MENISNYNPQLVIVEPKNKIRTFSLSYRQTVIGRAMQDSKCDIKIASPIVSAHHGMITKFNDSYYYNNNCANKNKTYINKNEIPRTSEVLSPAIKLRDGDIISIGPSADPNCTYLIFSTTTNKKFEWKTVDLKNKANVSIGRTSENDICLPNVIVSRTHAQIKNVGGLITLTDLKSHNGTILNGKIITSEKLNNGDKILIGSSKLFLINGIVLYSVPKKEEAINKEHRKIPSNKENKEKVISIKPNKRTHHNTNGIEIEIKDISRIVKCKKGTGLNGTGQKYILEHVSLSIHAGELVAICGGSGAGKTTFMNCINGFEPATSGQVLINGADLYKNYASLKNNIGYVPQQDIVHDNLTLKAMLTYTAKLRLQSDVAKQEIDDTVSYVLKMVDLEKEKDTYIKKLSGGQKKRASIAVELVSNPSLFFLDEPTSGLDPEAETHLMHNLQRLSNEEGKTVIVITHTLQNIDLFDKIVFLAPGGKLCFYGSPDNARKFFGVSNLADAYEKISKKAEYYVSKFEKEKGGKM